MKIKFSLIIVKMLSTSTISVLYKKLFDIFIRNKFISNNFGEEEEEDDEDY